MAQSNGSIDLTRDYHRTLAIAALFKESVSIDWLADLLIGRRPSQILSHLETGVRDGWLATNEPGSYRFSDSKKQRQWKDKLPVEEEKKLHMLISDILMRELPDGGEKANALGHHLIHVFNDVKRCSYLAKAGDLHLNAFRNEDALQCYSKVLDDLANQSGEEEDRLFSETAIKVLEDFYRAA